MVGAAEDTAQKAPGDVAGLIGDWADRLVREAFLHGPCESEAWALLKRALEVRNERTTKLLREKSQPARPNRNRTGQGITGS